MSYKEAFEDLEQYIKNEYRYHTHYGSTFQVEFIEGFMIEMHRLKKKWNLIGP